MSGWVRLWCDMPTDPKWRVIARRSGRSLSEVISVFVFMMTNAGANASERGELFAWSDEDVAAALDLDHEVVCAIREAMQGKTLDGDKLTGWERRQPRREDNSADRAKAWREAKKAKEREENENERIRTQANAQERPDADSDAEADNPSEASNDASGAPAPPAGMDEDPKEVLFKRGVEWLCAETGKSERSVKTAVGQMLKLAGGDTHASRVLGILRDAKRERKADPIAWTMGMLQQRAIPASALTSRPERGGALTLLAEHEMRKIEEYHDEAGIFDAAFGVLPVAHVDGSSADRGDDGGVPRNLLRLSR